MPVLDSATTPNAPAPFWNAALRYGGIGGLVLVVFSLVSYLMGISPMSVSTMIINFVVALGITVGLSAMAIRHHRDVFEGGYIGFGRALLIGLLTTAIAVFISSLWNYVLINFIDPEYVNTLKEQFVETWGEAMPADQLEKALSDFDKAGEIGTTLKNGLIGALVLGLIAGLIAAGIMKRNPPIE
ncbi:MAG: DUF4199 domain-containing protein [Saprospirales bacterium]|nr:DUF4199 domain-containing protein [Saprospirales bacterium]